MSKKEEEKILTQKAKTKNKNRKKEKTNSKILLEKTILVFPLYMDKICILGLTCHIMLPPMLPLGEKN